ncbi:MAG: hypothetical protein KDA25_06180, partial [Phycisphaerales bacterium]|nr:hypothetical protein [Phycisphaerales bacterium]
MTMTIQALVGQLVATLLGSEDDVYDRNYAVGLVTEFNDDASKTGAWTGLAKSAFCARLSELIAKPYLLNQGGTSFCAPAAVLYVFALHYPRKFADFAMRLFATGTTKIGTREIEMTSGIRETDLTTWITSTNWGINVTDMLLILAIQEDMTFLDIDGPGDYALAPPFLEAAYASDVKATLGGSGLFEVEDLDDTAA